MIRLLLVDDHPLVRDGLKARLASEPDIEVVGEAGDAPEAIVALATHAPTLVLMDIGMKDVNGIELTTMLLQRVPTLAVLMLSMYDSVEYAQRAMQAGARGSGSTQADFDAVEADFDQRFKTLPAYLDVMRRVWNGEAVHGPALSVWPGTEGGPPVLLGAWRSPRWINLAARHCQGWIGSGIYSEWDDFTIGIDMYRRAGGKRVVLANIFTDLRPDPAPNQLAARAKISLYCPPAEARERLKRLEGMGVDDALLVCPFDAPDQLEAMRGLLG